MSRSKERQKYLVPQVERMLYEIGLKLKLSRYRRHLSKKELAEMCDMSIDTITRLETDTGKVSAATLFTAIFMLNRMDELKNFLSPGEDIHANVIDSDALLSKPRVTGRKRWKPIEGFPGFETEEK